MRLGKIIALDQKYSDRLRLDDKKFLQRYICIFFAHSGDSWFWLLGLFLIWVLTKGEWHTKAAFLAVGLFLLAIVVLILKFSIRRPRPEGEWGQIYRATDPHSFPSGHAARAFALAIMAFYSGPLWFSILMGLWAPLVGLARIRLGVHYVSDVIVGALVGILMGLIANALQPSMQALLPWVF